MEQQPSLLKEIRTHGTSSFPCANYRTYFKGKGRLVKPLGERRFYGREALA